MYPLDTNSLINGAPERKKNIYILGPCFTAVRSAYHAAPPAVCAGTNLEQRREAASRHTSSVLNALRRCVGLVCRYGADVGWESVRRHFHSRIIGLGWHLMGRTIWSNLVKEFSGCSVVTSTEKSPARYICFATSRFVGWILDVCNILWRFDGLSHLKPTFALNLESLCSFNRCHSTSFSVTLLWWLCALFFFGKRSGTKQKGIKTRCTW